MENPSRMCTFERCVSEASHTSRLGHHERPPGAVVAVVVVVVVVVVVAHPGRAGDFRSLSICSFCPPLFMEDSGNELGVVHRHLNSSPMLASAAKPEPVLTVSASDLTATAVCAGGCDHIWSRTLCASA